MNVFRSTLLLCLLLSPLTLWAEKPTIATVNMQKLFSEYYVAVDQRGSIDSLKERLKDDPRIKTVKELVETLKGLEKTLRDPATPETEKEKLFEEYQAKGGELKALQRDTQQHIDAEQTKINTKLVEMTRNMLADIQKAVAVVAEKEGYQLVFESQGHTSSQLPTLLYIRHGDDITDLVLSHLNKGQKPPEATESPPP